MAITPPFGYSDIQPFLRTQKVIFPAAGTLPDFARQVNVLPLSFSEFPVACRDYPIVFVSGDGGQTFMSMAVVGLEAKQNLFSKDGAWEANTYVPAYVRRYPFCMARTAAVDRDERIVCVEKASVGKDGESLFDKDGKPLERWNELEKLLHEFEADLERGHQLARTLAELKLLEPFTMQATLNSGRAFALSGMHRVDERKLGELPGTKLKDLAQRGLLGRIYAHLLSLDNFSRMINRVPADAGPWDGKERRKRSSRRKAEKAEKAEKA